MNFVPAVAGTRSFKPGESLCHRGFLSWLATMTQPFMGDQRPLALQRVAEVISS